MSDFSGKNILVVGGSSSIGPELSRRLIAGNATVAVWSPTEPAGFDPADYRHSQK